MKRRELLKSAAALGATAAVGWRFVTPGGRDAPCIRPPGALPEDDFLSTCIRCGRCGDACPARANATTTCSGGSCGFTCLAGFDDCIRNDRLPSANVKNGARSAVIVRLAIDAVREEGVQLWPAELEAALA